ncbi:DNA-protecting protein DprA [Erysipelothrix inopinata]|uniref:DNA-protecting protein DprA n=1 Tax=Erysipelothrix inopinata TaxID=225084 RepID=A0A7G9S1N6_9FIRM|nr:DNA-processing protein DprA [Erysipelothrix inopinata]QNN61761.1 DNA-protecting protein DprA [Erysipelothrix inopinata]
MDRNQIIITLLNIKGIGNQTILKHESKINENMDQGTLYDLIINNINKNLEFDIFSQAVGKSELIIKECTQNNILITNFLQDDYPGKLLSLDNPPVILFYKGSIERLRSHPSIAIVGTREPSNYGKEITKRYADYVAKNNINVISGLAKGIDSIAHESTIQAGGYTAAILAQGLNTAIYPKENNELAERILANNGALISEYMPGLMPSRNTFVERDRIQSGTSDGVLVIEAAKKSGTMHAANSILSLERTLGVFKHPEKYVVNNDKALGNSMLIDEKGAMAVFYESELMNFISLVKKHHDYFIGNHVNAKDNLERQVDQISFDI